ncbi:glycosyltransferase family 9 protein, partial [uncultured Aeromicrobium sp.]|uniref:glycosyltransferase family 9 protein n=1 Tax=uncultured Aeromicrobium sp. TaxID=337820 RepID=UPI0025F75326
MSLPWFDDRPVLLVLRALKLGDLLVAVPALRALRRAFPEHRIVYASQGWLEPVVRLTGSVDEHLHVHGLDEPIPLPPKVVDVAVNLHGNGEQSRGRLDALEPRRRVGHLAPGWEGPEWVVGIHERERWCRMLQWHGIDAHPGDLRLDPPTAANPVPEAAVVHVGAAYGSRLWPLERFAAVARELGEAGHPVVFTGSEGERPRALEAARRAGFDESAVVAGRLGLGEFAAVVAGAAVVVAADTGAAHLATAYGRASVVIFGPAPPSEWGPPPGPHVVLTDESQRRGEVFADDPDPSSTSVVAPVSAAISSTCAVS